MLRKSEGKIFISGCDLDDDLKGIRKSLGVCTQKDLLYEFMDVREHLEFICGLKGIPEGEIQTEVDRIIQSCCLENEKEKFSQNLSGGNKRKLSLAMALVGGSKIVFLDEPSSGLDPNSRRMIWDILEKVRDERRTIILTTHHLEEAEHLAQRIGIMAKGKLLTVGTNEFIKTQFGVGYHLQVSLRSLESAPKFETQSLVSDQ